MEDEVYDGIDYEEIELEEILQEQKVEKVDGHLRFKKWNNFSRAERIGRISDSKSKGTNLAKWLNVAVEYFDNRCALSGEEFIEFEERASGKLTNLSAEHVVALTNGGQDILPNLVPSVLQYNVRKNGYYLLDWWEKQDNIDGTSIYSPYRLLQLVNYMTKTLDAREYFKSGKLAKYRDTILTPNDIDLFLAEIIKIDEAIPDDRNAERNLISSVKTATTEIEDGKKILTSIPDLEEGIPEQVNQPLMEKQNEREMIDIFLYDAILKLKEDLTIDEIERIKNQARENGVEISENFSIDKVMQRLEDTRKSLEGTISYELEIRASIMSALKDLDIKTNEYSIANILMFSEAVLTKMNEKSSAQDFGSYISSYLTEKMKGLSNEFGITVEEAKSILIYNTEALYNDEARENLRLILKFYEQTGVNLEELLSYKSNIHIANIMRIEEWCEEKFYNEEEWKRRIPRQISDLKAVKTGELETDEQRELRLATVINTITKKYGKKELKTPLEKIFLKKLQDIINKYDVNMEWLGNNIEEIEKWCEETFAGKPKWERRLPRQSTTKKIDSEISLDDQREFRLGRRFAWIIRKYSNKNDEELTPIEKNLLKRIELLKSEYGISYDEKCIMEIEAWCEGRFRDVPKYERYLPRTGINGVNHAKKGEIETDEQREIRLGCYMKRLREVYENKEFDNCEKNELAKRVEYILREYGMSSDEKRILKIEEWCQETFNGKPKYKRRLPRVNIGKLKVAREGEEECEEQIELRVGKSLNSLKQKYKNKIEKGEELSFIETKIWERLNILEREYGMSVDEKQIMEIESWCEETFKNQPKYKRRFPRLLEGIEIAKDGENESQREKRLAKTVRRLRIKYMDKTSLNPVELELCERLEKLATEYDFSIDEQNIMELEAWCEETFKGQPIYKRRFPRLLEGIEIAKDRENESKKQKEKRLGSVVQKLRYKYKDKTSLNSVDLELCERFEKLATEYGFSTGKQIVIEIECWCEENFKNQPKDKRRMPRKIHGVKVAKDGNVESEEQREVRLATSLFNLRQKIKNKKEEGKLTLEDIELMEHLNKIAIEYDTKGTTKSFLQSILKSRATLSGAIQAAQEIASIENARNAEIEI